MLLIKTDCWPCAGLPCVPTTCTCMCIVIMYIYLKFCIILHVKRDFKCIYNRCSSSPLHWRENATTSSFFVSFFLLFHLCQVHSEELPTVLGVSSVSINPPIKHEVFILTSVCFYTCNFRQLAEQRECCCMLPSLGLKKTKLTIL